MIIDAHQHFWTLDRGDYGWLTPDLEPLYRDFMPDDLAPHLDLHGIDGTILVQAAPTMAETAFLLDIAARAPFVLGVVGWVDFAAPAAADDIMRLARNPKLVGLRPMIQDIADDSWMLRSDLTAAFEAMIAADLAFDALVLPRHLPQLRELLSRHPDLRTVVDHGAKPDIAGGLYADWAEDLATIADETGAYCKLSGLLTEASADWDATDIAPYAAHLFAHFGPERLVWGSDWPVLTCAASYGTWFDLAKTFVPNGPAREAAFGSNARALYRLTRL
ncbi:L-fuconolactonase [Yoonia maricola]|uniref:L-fuconolactonase n=1 Tax=Yoonia maricola TaxID=420999 RepID=A0A2M8W028_9RHOB|nr:amidohydrolase family protein [Yoonia maricola]PJI84278.1 L-fuconolactonase [Yoonia maricola]